jgi:hypothetical protein
VTGSAGAPGSTGSNGGTTTSVLGEKLTKTPGSTSPESPGVEATGVSALPMTGFAASHALQIAALFLGLGIGATVVGQRRRPTHHYIQVRN